LDSALLFLLTMRVAAKLVDKLSSNEELITGIRHNSYDLKHAEEMCQYLVSSKGRLISFQLQNTGMLAKSCRLQAIFFL